MATAKETRGEGWAQPAFRQTAAALFVLLCSLCHCVASKPWGDLETEIVLLEPPDEYLSSKRFGHEKLDWFLPPQERTNFVEQLTHYDLTPEQRAVFQQPDRWRVSTNGYWFSPTRGLLLEMSPMGRSQVYLALAKYPENIYQNRPFILQSGDIDGCFTNSGLSEATLKSLKGLLYKRGPCWCFSDIVVFEDLAADEFKRLLKTLTRVPAVILQLRISPESDVHGLTRYWGREGTEKNTKMLLESLAKVPGGTAIDVTHFLPPFARERLYRFPEKKQPQLTDRQQCFWTALNFFNATPDDRFATTASIQEALKNDYVRVFDDAVFGDLVALADGTDQILHCSVYIADDVVFTKNGGSVLKPWVLMKLPDMVAMYSAIGARQVHILRRKRE